MIVPTKEVFPMVRLVHAQHQFVSPLEANHILGRGHNVNIAIVSPTVSRKHATFHFDERDGRWYVEDLNSKNGTYINGARVFVAPLENGDEVQFGAEVFYFYND